jgi:hypothetical protein
MTFAWLCRDVDDSEFLLSNLNNESLISIPNVNDRTFDPAQGVRMISIGFYIFSTKPQFHIEITRSILPFFFFTAWWMFWQRSRSLELHRSRPATGH